MSVVLAVVAHADDESLFAGAALAQHAFAGDRVVVAVLSDGESSRFTIAGDVNELPAILMRQSQFRSACGILGAEACWFPVFPDQRSDDVPQLVINRAVEALVTTYRPLTVYTHHVGDLNLDHRRVAEAVLVATRPRMGWANITVYSMAPEWPLRCVGPLWTPTVRLPIASAKEKKIAACWCYDLELREYPHPRSLQALAAQTHEDFMEIR